MANITYSNYFADVDGTIQIKGVDVFYRPVDSKFTIKVGELLIEEGQVVSVVRSKLVLADNPFSDINETETDEDGLPVTLTVTAVEQFKAFGTLHKSSVMSGIFDKVHKGLMQNFTVLHEAGGKVYLLKVPQASTQLASLTNKAARQQNVLASGIAKDVVRRYTN